jgi:hypothetical protein
MQKLSKLIEVVRTRHINIIVYFQFGAFRDSWNAKDDNCDIVTEAGLSAYSKGSCKKSFGREA